MKAGIEQPADNHLNVWRFSRSPDGEVAHANDRNGEGMFRQPAFVEQSVAQSRHSVVQQGERPQQTLHLKAG